MGAMSQVANLIRIALGTLAIPTGHNIWRDKMDSEIEKLEKMYIKVVDEKKELEEENEQLKSRVRQLLARPLQKKCKELEEKLKVVKKALEFYADKDIYGYKNDIYLMCLEDRGEKAQKALKSIGLENRVL
jgi:predicted nuclease with TOPRIM domain